MPLPKRRHSNQRTRKRRTHYKLELPALVRCTVCAPLAPGVFQMRLDHHACPVCGTYNGRQAIKIKEAATTEE